MTLTQITEKGIKDGEILNADINTSAAIAGSKINPLFTSNIEIQNNAPGITFTDSNDSHQFYIQTDGDALNLVDATNSTTKLGISNTGHITLRGNVTVNDGYLEVSNSNLYIEENITHAGDGDTRIRFPAADNISFETAGSSRVYIDSTGKTGINISTPQSLLELSAATDTVMGIELGRAGDSITASRYIGICQTNNATNLAVNSGFSGVEFGGPASTREGYLAFHTHDTGVGSGERMCIDKSGQVGIGTASPDRLIHAAGATPILKLDATNNEAYIQLKTASPSNETYIGLVNGDIYMATSGTGATTGERFRIKANGRVGINASTPGATLHVFDPNGDNVTAFFNTTANANYIQLSDSVNNHCYIAKENSANRSQTVFYATTEDTTATQKVAHFDYRGLVLPANKGISFSPHDNTGTDPYGSDSNLLDDYERGSFQPAITSTSTHPSQNTYSHQYGYYVKIGRLVHVRVDVLFSPTGVSGGTGEAILSNLPFINSSESNAYGISMAVGYSPNWYNNGCPTGGYMNPSASWIYLMPYNVNGETFTQAANVGGGTRLIAGFSYQADS